MKLIAIILIGLLVRTSELHTQQLASWIGVHYSNTTASSQFQLQDDSLLGPTKYLWRPFYPSTIGAQLLAGAGSTGASYLVTIVAVVGTRSVAGLYVYPLAIGILIPTGIYMAGNAMKGNGSYVATLLMGDITAAIYAASQRRGGNETSYFLVELPLVTTIGSIIGYNLTGTSIKDISTSLVEFNANKTISFGCPQIRTSIDQRNKLFINATIVSAAL